MNMYLRLVLVLLTGSACLMRNAIGLSHNTFIFSVESSTDYVMLTPEKEMKFDAFTLCLRAFTDLTRAYSLFSYASYTKDNDFLLYALSKEMYSIYVGGSHVTFKANSVQQTWNHICATWDSNTGLSGLWMNGVRSVRKMLAKGYTIRSGGVIVLGQEQDRPGGGFDAAQSFVGELNSVNLWDYVLSPQEIHDASEMMYRAAGNVIDWSTVKLNMTENVAVVKDSDTCKINVVG
ncbi:serum amyloid P-component-like [Protopterus annectens]|uniref:serum amyloid P-component-like n=1 Tax=Protopterus annectens TaxID=7888 RepID=UPI001CF93AE9|nr:serum amyloid P-component-like [Protopterus annectens]